MCSYLCEGSKKTEFIDTKNRLVVTRGGGGGWISKSWGWKVEDGTAVNNTLLCICNLLRS